MTAHCLNASKKQGRKEKQKRHGNNLKTWEFWWRYKTKIGLVVYNTISSATPSGNIWEPERHSPNYADTNYITDIRILIFISSNV